MKKSLLLMAALVMMPINVYGQENEIEDRLSVLESQVQELMEKEKSKDETETQAEESETNREQSYGEGVRVIEELPESMDEGWEFTPLNTISISSVKIANIRYNNEFLFVDISLVNNHSGDRKIINILESVYRVTQPYNEDATNKDANTSKNLQIQVQQLPAELEGTYPTLQPRDQMPESGQSVTLTIPYKLSVPIEKGSKIYFEFGDNQTLEFELESASKVI